MKIYHNFQYLSKLKRFKFKQDDWFFCRLIGISLEESENDTLEVLPVYRSLGIAKYPGQLILSVPLFRKDLLISFSGRGIEITTVDADQLHVPTSER